MTAYNFLAGWQLFPEKCIYENGTVPKSGTYNIAERNGQIVLSNNYVTQTNDAFTTDFALVADGESHAFDDTNIAAFYTATIKSTSVLEIIFTDADGNAVLTATHEILHNGWLQVTQQYNNSDGNYVNTNIYHKQLSILPYASSAGSVAIRPTKEGVIKHKALSAMEEQTNMQLDQIREQITLLAKQAAQLQQRKSLSLKIYESKLSFKPQIGQTYHLYQKKDDSHILSLVAPKEWGGAGPFKNFISSVRLLADHTWMEVSATV
jgi:uncharacterized protein YkuJ